MGAAYFRQQTYAGVIPPRRTPPAPAPLQCGSFNVLVPRPLLTGKQKRVANTVALGDLRERTDAAVPGEQQHPRALPPPIPLRRS